MRVNPVRCPERLLSCIHLLIDGVSTHLPIFFHEEAMSSVKTEGKTLKATSGGSAGVQTFEK